MIYRDKDRVHTFRLSSRMMFALAAVQRGEVRDQDSGDGSMLITGTTIKVVNKLYKMGLVARTVAPCVRDEVEYLDDVYRLTASGIEVLAWIRKMLA